MWGDWVWVYRFGVVVVCDLNDGGSLCLSG
jgi:hypothetical protein